LARSSSRPNACHQILHVLLFHILCAATATMGDLSVDVFDGADRLFIQQELSIVELALGVEAPNRYRISKSSEDDKEGSVFLYVSEESDCLKRIICGKNRPLTLKVHEGSSEEGPVILTMEKPFSCSGCCCFRGSFDVKADGEQVGFIEDPCRCCWTDLKAMDAQKSTMFMLGGSPWQCGMLCPCCGGDVNFKLTKEDQTVGKVTKKRMDCKELIAGMNRFVVDMTDIADPVERRMVFASAMLLDLNYFEASQSSNSSSSSTYTSGGGGYTSYGTY